MSLEMFLLRLSVLCFRFLTCDACAGTSRSVFLRLVCRFPKRRFLRITFLSRFCLSAIATCAWRLNALLCLALERVLHSTSWTKFLSPWPLRLGFGVRLPLRCLRPRLGNTVRAAWSVSALASHVLRLKEPRFYIGRFRNLSSCLPISKEALISNRKSIHKIPLPYVGREQTQNVWP